MNISHCHTRQRQELSSSPAANRRSHAGCAQALCSFGSSRQSTASKVKVALTPSTHFSFTSHPAALRVDKHALTTAHRIRQQSQDVWQSSSKSGRPIILERKPHEAIFEPKRCAGSLVRDRAQVTTSAGQMDLSADIRIPHVDPAMNATTPAVPAIVQDCIGDRTPCRL